MYIIIHLKYPLFFSEFNEKLFFRHIFEKYSYIKFYKNPSSVSRVQCGQMEMTNLTVAFRALNARK
jgi:hypothetical protein